MKTKIRIILVLVEKVNDWLTFTASTSIHLTGFPSFHTISIFLYSGSNVTTLVPFGIASIVPRTSSHDTLPHLNSLNSSNSVTTDRPPDMKKRVSVCFRDFGSEMSPAGCGKYLISYWSSRRSRFITG